eukprot:TRINITY_DN18630_c0_g1_i2.p1 TRINITY_DN18630_c0_g1~~TRINITY_DN18630_c0_g1_i2.p1  ORF type:complete len:459 (+),score=49.22 TRINITY_DN18630_c0_g1_i2:47-1378(+)
MINTKIISSYSSIRQQRRVIPFGAVRDGVDVGLKLQTPHSGYHYDGLPRRFFEGWYWRVTLPDVKQSFSLIYSIEDPQGDTPLSGVGAQVMGPDDGYICQFSKNVNNFWANRNNLALGSCFLPSAPRRRGTVPKQLVEEDHFNDMIEQGFQASDTWHQGCIIMDDSKAGAPGYIPNSVDVCKWAFRVRPLYGWGDSGKIQRSTAGWLAILPVFEPHWQVLMAHGMASGWILWGDKKYTFSEVPTYSEKNWGGSFPSKWFWIQCNSFENEPNLSVTVAGARRGLLNVPGVEEEVGMIGIHFQGVFIEFTPVGAQIEWSVETWGKWRMSAKQGEYEALIEAETNEAGVLLRAPTSGEGLVPFCRDTFKANVKLTVWKLKDGQRQEPPTVQALSDTGAAEVGGGPWWSTWNATAKMRQPLKSVIQLPVDLDTISSFVPSPFKPPGL